MSREDIEQDMDIDLSDPFEKSEDNYLRDEDEKRSWTMAKTKIMKRQVNSGNETEEVVCPHTADGLIHKPQPAFACPLNCDRYANKEDGFIVCGTRGANKDMLVTCSRPTLWQVLRTYGQDDRGSLCG